MSGSRIDSAPLSILLDVRHPFSYLALGPAIEFGRARGLEINWLPLAAPPLKPPSDPAPEDDRGTRHRRARAQMIAREVEIYGAAQGLVLRDHYRSGSAGALHRGWLFLREFAPDRLESYLGEAFRLYWAGGLDPADHVAVLRVVAEVGGDAAHFDGWNEGEGARVAEEIALDLSARGFVGVPGYYLPGVGTGEFFHGRQHLPMIEWLLDGRPGPGPI